MRFGPVPLAHAEGALLAHTTRLPNLTLRKGAVLGFEAIAALREAGRSDVIVATLEPDDVAENAAADRLADALAAPGLICGKAATGRVNLRAQGPGLVMVNPRAVDAINHVDEAITLATVADQAAVAGRQIVATIKIIPFAVSERVLALAEQAARATPDVLRLMPFVPRRVGLVLTVLPGLRDDLLVAAHAATAERIERYEGKLLTPVTVRHETTAIGTALLGLMREKADLLLIIGASAVVDRQDVGPAGIIAAGGEVLHFGMPVDPGNLLCLGRIGTVPTIVLPGCARSPKPNGIDAVLARLFARLPVTAADIMGLGVGGLLEDSPMRGVHREHGEGADRDADAVADADADLNEKPEPEVAVIVLAAGRSTRLAPRHKLLVTDASGRAMIARVVDAALASRAHPVLVVTGYRAAEIEAALAGREVRFIFAPDHADGLAASLRAGIAAVPAEAAAALICLGDMPLVETSLLNQLIDAYDPGQGRSIVYPTYQSQPGNPIVWDRHYFAEMQALSGDRGARALLGRHAAAAAAIEVGTDAVLRDFDTVAQLRTLSA